jgi:hypothetical protein
MSANSGPLKPGVLCWLTGTIAANIGKIVEILSFEGNYPGLGDTYKVKTKEPLIVSTYVLDSYNGQVVAQMYSHLSGDQVSVARKQLIPINDPNQQEENTGSLLDEIQSIAVKNSLKS